MPGALRGGMLLTMEHFGEATRTWFTAAFEKPTEVQRRGWEAISREHHALLVAPTGSGKTLAAFLWGIDRLSRLSPEVPPGVRLLYVSPLKALVYDVERNLRAPLAGILRTAERLGLPLREVRVDVRTGDTPARERRLQARRPADILVTTPESLFLILGSAARQTLATVETVIVDEIHSLAPVKRGSHLALSLERLAELAGRAPQRIGLSATVRPAEEVARFLGGDRPVEVVNASAPPLLDLEVVVPVPDMEHVSHPLPERRGGSILGGLAAAEAPAPPPERGIWPAIYPALLAEIRAHRSTIVFVNSRGLCERLARRLNELAGEELVRAHHGSVAREQRIAVEEALKRGELRGIVATSSLELGIDMGAVDLVLLVESPGSVARGLQRVGRAGHRVGEVSAGRIFPKFRGDLLEAAVVASLMLRGEIEPLRIPRAPLDVLAQQVAAICSDRPRSIAEIEGLVRRAHPYRDLSREALTAVLDMLSGRYPSTDFADLHPLLAWDRSADLLSPRRGTAMLVRMNAGTIPDRGSYGVYLGPDGPRIGELDEEMVFETRTGSNILLGASTWRVEEITRDRVIVSPAPGEPGRLPFWHGEGPGRPVELGRAIGAFVRELGEKRREEAVGWLMATLPLAPFAAENLAAYVFGQKEATGALPTDRAITIERFRDELGDWRVCILTPFGARIHAPWAMALQRTLSARESFEPQVMYTDDGICLRFADVEELPGAELLLPDPEEVEGLVTGQLADTALFASLFRENAARSLLLPRQRPDRRTPLWAQRLKAQQLLAAVRRYPAFPVVIETYRQALADIFDLPGLKLLLRQVRSRQVHVTKVETRAASPFARSLVFAYVATYLYEQDAPLAERKAQALTLDRALLQELLGQAELRELIDPEALAEVEAELQHRYPDRRARDADALHDLLRRLGDMTSEEIAARCTEDPALWLARLEAERRAAPVRVAGERRWIAAEDAALYRDALGAVPPAGLPASFLEPAESPLERLLRRFARTRGPFLTREAAGRFGITPAQAEPVLRALEAEGILVRGEIRPGGVEPDWCDAEVLRRLKRRTLARLRREAAPVEARSFALFLPAWHGIPGERGLPGRLEEAVAQLEGLPLPWSTLSQVLLPARLPGLTLDQLDILAATGRIVWVGRGPLGHRDGRIALFRRERAHLLLSPAAGTLTPGPLHAAILAHLERRGASFLAELEGAARRERPEASAAEFTAALWDLVWAGEITNDTFAPLRSLSGGARPLRGRRQTLAGGRWSLVRDLLDPAASETERAVARATMLLERYGIVSREAAQAEELPGGFATLYRTLKAMEEAGRVRRGYFVEGLSGAQFALAGAVDRLRGVRHEESPGTYREEDVLVLAAVDPANPYGALLPWPPAARADAGGPRRVPDAWIILVAGALALYCAPGGRQLLTFAPPGADGDILAAAFRALHRLPRAGRRRLLLIERIDGVPVYESPYVELLRRSGFESDYKGMVAAQGNWE